MFCFIQSLIHTNWSLYKLGLFLLVSNFSLLFILKLIIPGYNPFSVNVLFYHSSLLLSGKYLFVVGNTF